MNAARLALMKPTAYLINTARGPIVDQKALDRGVAGAAGLPAPASTCSSRSRPTPTDPILKLDNVILRAARAVLDRPVLRRQWRLPTSSAVLDIQHGRVPRGVVNRDCAGQGRLSNGEPGAARAAHGE